MTKTFKGPTFQGQPIGRGWWWLQFGNGPAPRYWDGFFWDRGSVLVKTEDYAEYPVAGPCVPPPEQLSDDALQAVSAASGHTIADAAIILEHLKLAGWELRHEGDLRVVQSSEDMAEYWRRAIGGEYQPVQWNPRHAHHPVRVNEVITKLKANEPCPGAADVIVGLVHSQAVAWNSVGDLGHQIQLVEDENRALKQKLAEAEKGLRMGGQADD